MIQRKYNRQEDDRKKIHRYGKAGFQAALNELLEKSINVKWVVTDAHLGIDSVMSEFI